MIRVGKVVEVDDKNAKVRVQIEDADAVITYWLPVVHQKTQHDKHYWLPDIGELVVCGFYEDDWDTGFVLGSIYNDKDKPPSQTRDKFVIEFKDGTRIEYDRTSHNLKIHVTGKVEIKATEVVVTGETVSLTASSISATATSISVNNLIVFPNGWSIAPSGNGLAFYDSSGYAVLIVRNDGIWFNGQKIK